MTAILTARLSSRRIAVAVGIFLQLAALVVLLLVVRQHRMLHRQVRGKIASGARFVPGDPLGAIPLLDLSGRPAAIDLKSGRHLIAIVNPHCGTCERTNRSCAPIRRSCCSTTVLWCGP